MKRFLALAALVLGLAACQTEPEGLDVNVGGAVDTTITVSLPEAETRSGLNSANGIFAENGLLTGDYTIRYILQVFYKGDESRADRQVIYSDGKTVHFPVRLVPGRAYSFVAWADVVPENGKELNVLGVYDRASDFRYNTENLEAVTFNGEWNAMDETFDAFTDVKEYTYYGNTPINLQLVRPFAKLRVLTTDMQVLSDLSIVPEGVTVKYNVPVYNSFNALAGEANNTTVTEKTFEYDLNESLYASTETTCTLFTNYLFGTEDNVIKFEMSVYDNTTAKELIKKNEFSTDIPVQRNYLTTISGNILTDGNNIKVEVTDGFVNVDNNGNTTDPDYDFTTISSAAELLTALETPGEFIVISDINIAKAGDTISDGEINTLATRSGDVKTIIDLNGHTITIQNTSTEEAIVTLEENHTVTFVGEGALILTDDSTQPFINNEQGTVEVAAVNHPDNENGVPVISNDVVDYADLLRQAFEKGENYSLVYNVTVSEPLTLAAGKSMVLDLNGKTITGYDNGTASYGLIVNQGTLTVKNGTITLVASQNRGWNAYSSVISNSCGTLTVEDDTVIEHLGGTDMAYGIDNLSGSKAAYATINGGHIKSTYRAIRQFMNSNANQNELTVNGGVIEGANKSIWMQDPNKNANYGKLTVEAEAQLKGDVYLFVTAGSPEWPVEVSIADTAFVDESTVVTGNVPAAYSVVEKDGVWTVEKCYEETENGYAIKNAAGMKWFAEQVDGGETFEGMTIELTADIDLYEADENGEAICFDPIGDYRSEKVFRGTFDGHDYTIKNLNQNTWALDIGYYYGSGLGLGLFACVEDATIKNLKMDKASISGESALCGIVAATAYGDCTFENIYITNSQCADYQYYAGGIVGWASGNHQYINCNIDATTTVATQWGDFDNSTGGVIGGAGGSAQILMKDCNVACRIDAHNDVVSAYRWYAYRRCGMLIGNTGKTETVDGHTVAIAPQLTCENVTVTYGDWANYTYCEFAGTGYPYVRVQAGVSVGAYSNVRYGHPTDANGNTVVDDNHVHNEGEDHDLLLAFDQLYGGGQGVYGNPTHEGVTVVYNNK